MASPLNGRHSFYLPLTQLGVITLKPFIFIKTIFRLGVFFFFCIIFPNLLHNFYILDIALKLWNLMTNYDAT